MNTVIKRGTPGVLRRLKLYSSMIRYGNAHNEDFAREHAEFFKGMTAYCGDWRGKRVLDVGCGKSFWLTLLLHSAGAEVTGIDAEVTDPRIHFQKYLGIARRNGVERALRTWFWDYRYARPYYEALARYVPFALRFDGIDTRAMSATALDFPDRTFDLVVSHEVFEHIADVPATLKSLARALKPEGRTYIYIHNYTSLSGGHHIAWKYPDTEPSTTVPPWDHLRENRHADIPSWINRLREHEYRPMFEEYFDILDWFPLGEEGRALLTPALKRELALYSEHELLTKGFVVVAKPKKTTVP